MFGYFESFQSVKIEILTFFS